MDRVYAQPRYDADFDRGNPSSSRQTAQRTLFDPNAPPQPTHHSQSPRHAQPQEHSGADASAASTRRPTRSKREPVNVLDLGRRVATGRGPLAEHESRESIESEDSVVSHKSKTGSKSSRDGIRPRRSRKDESSRTTRDGDSSLKSVTANATSAAAPSTARQLFDPRRDDPVRFSQAPPANAASHRRREMSNGGVSSSVSLVSTASTQVEPTADREAGSRTQQHPLVAQLKDLYRHITALETQLQEEHRIALSLLAQDEDNEPAVKIKGGSTRFDDEYWAKLAVQHKELADLHYSFMQMALDSQLPASMQALPQKYNIPSRLWQTAFHQLLERMRYAIVSPRASHASSETSPPASVLEHLIEFIQYGYGHYSQLYEDPTVATFRAAWIEQLGDLARYRMAVAGLSARISASAQRQRESEPRDSDLSLLEDAHSPSRPADQASIGVAALNDWDVEEQDSWRTIARDWYNQGISESPGTGRLQHHLALLSKGDELRSMYHFAKSLTTSHPYASARESILPLFEEEHQARRTRSEVSKAELFVHLHGMLFTKIALDDFEEVAARFMEKLKEEGLLLARTDGAWSDTTSRSEAPFDEGAWMMLAVINIAALLQYGAEDGVLRPFFVKESQPQGGASSSSKKQASTKAPQAIMVHSTSSARPTDGNDVENGRGSLEDGVSASGSPPQDVVMSLNPASDDDPTAFRYAQQLTFDMLDLALTFPVRRVGESEIANPYIVLILTFMSQLSQHDTAMTRIERYVPWKRLAEYLNLLQAQCEGRIDINAKMTGPALPEDWCVRGMSWTSKTMYGRGFFRERTVAGADEDARMQGLGMHSEAEALALSLSSLDTQDGANNSVAANLAAARRKRVLVAAGCLVRNVAGFDLTRDDEGTTTLTIGGALEAKISRWKRADEEAAEAVRLSRLSLQAKARQEEDVEDESDESESEEEPDDETDSPELRELKARRRHLKAVVRQARQATRGTTVRRTSAEGKKGHRTRSNLKLVAGYTVLVFDTNIILSSLHLLQALIQTGMWTVVVPLTVVTELDGLKRNETDIGSAAHEAILYLETAVKTCSRVLRVQTSRGNYLHDLTIRSESIDFSAEGDRPGSGYFSHESARSMDDVILRAVAWQQEHFTNRLFMLNPSADKTKVAPDSCKVVLITFDRNLRLKARARGLDAADETEMVSILPKMDAGGAG
ncbi:hypothetical protein ACM66B_000146 [Microbotryomycetes sp. NB124-2]